MWEVFSEFSVAQAAKKAGEYLIKDVAMGSIEKKIESDKAKVAMAAD